MKVKDYLECVLHSFERYYDIKKTEVTPPFDAEARFLSHEEQYFLVKSAKLGETDSSETVYFSVLDSLDLNTLITLDAHAWENGIKNIHPSFGHRNSDVSLVILSEKVEEDVFKAVKKLHHSKSYFCSLKGWSNYRLIVTETSTKRIACNRLGKDFIGILNSIY